MSSSKKTELEERPPDQEDAARSSHQKDSSGSLQYPDMGLASKAKAQSINIRTNINIASHSTEKNTNLSTSSQFPLSPLEKFSDESV